MYIKFVNFQHRFFLFLIFSIFITSCTDEVKIRKSALHYFEEGNSALKHRDYQIAIWNYQKAISLDSESPNFHYNLGLTYYEIGNYIESIESFKKVEKLVPNQTDTYYNLALAHYKMSNSRMADIYYNRYQEMLSLRKAQERLLEVRKEQERENRIGESNSRKNKLNKNSSTAKKKSYLNKADRKGKASIPNWDN